MAPPATFDHDECRALYATGQFTQVALARRYGVSATRIGHIVNPAIRARVNAASKAWVHLHYHTDCRECGATIWKRGHAPNQTGLCLACLGASRRTAEHGTETRYNRGCHCDLCRAGATAARRRRRHAERTAA